MAMFLVYEVDTQSRTAARTASGQEERNGFPAEPLGCYVADDAAAACALAAKQHGAPVYLAAIEVKAEKLKFTAEELGSDALKKLTQSAKKEQEKQAS